MILWVSTDLLMATTSSMSLGRPIYCPEVQGEYCFSKYVHLPVEGMPVLPLLEDLRLSFTAFGYDPNPFGQSHSFPTALFHLVWNILSYFDVYKKAHWEIVTYRLKIFKKSLWGKNGNKRRGGSNNVRCPFLTNSALMSLLDTLAYCFTFSSRNCWEKYLNDYDSMSFSIKPHGRKGNSWTNWAQKTSLFFKQLNAMSEVGMDKALWVQASTLE